MACVKWLSNNSVIKCKCYIPVVVSTVRLFTVFRHFLGKSSCSVSWQGLTLREGFFLTWQLTVVLKYLQWKIGDFLAFPKGATFVKSIRRLKLGFLFVVTFACVNITVKINYTSRVFLNISQPQNTFGLCSFSLPNWILAQTLASQRLPLSELSLK